MDLSFLAQLDRTAHLNNVGASRVNSCGLMLRQLLWPGDYLLADGRRFVATVYGQERGIFISEGERYTVLEFLSSIKYSKEGMKRVITFAGGDFSLPTKHELETILNNAPAINRSLMCIGRADARLEQDEDLYWYEGCSHFSGAPNRRLLLLGTSRQERFYGYTEFCASPFCCEGVEFAHTSFAEPYYLLQRLTPNEFYVLDVRCRTMEMRSWDREYNGSVRQENGLLVVENPINRFYEDGEAFVKTQKMFFRNVTGLYAYDHQESGRWHYIDDDD